MPVELYNGRSGVVVETDPLQADPDCLNYAVVPDDRPQGPIECWPKHQCDTVTRRTSRKVKRFKVPLT